MGQSRRETEIKLAFDSPDQARRCLEGLGARLVQERRFEDNIVYDREGDPLVRAGKLLRLRRWGETATVTYKALVPGEHRHKVREEQETEVDRPGAVERILDGLGFHPVYRYQKYRTTYAVEALHVCLDETPMGCFVELEGPPDDIDRTAERMGFGRERYILETYGELHERRARERGVEPGDLIFEDRAERGR